MKKKNVASMAMAAMMAAGALPMMRGQHQK